MTNGTVTTLALFTFSGTGNTWWVSGRIAEALDERGVRCTVYSIEAVGRDAVREIVAKSDAVGFGYPIYGSDLPQPMKDFIDDVLPAVDPPKPSLVFCTQLLFSGDGAHVFARALRAKGYRIRWADHIRMPNNICVTVLPIGYSNDPRIIDPYLERARLRIDRLTGKIVSGRPARKGGSAFSWFLGIQQRFWYRLFFSRLRDDIRIDPDRCTLCGLCVRICSSGNLAMISDAEGSRIETRGRCVLCVRCYNFCPTQAVLYMGKPHKMERGVPYRGPVPDFRPEHLRPDSGTEEHRQ